MKRIITLLLAAVLALGLSGCGSFGPREKEPEQQGDINIIQLIRGVEPFHFPRDEEFADKRITRFRLSQALQAAAEKKLPDADGEAAGLALGQDGYWSRTYQMDSKADDGEVWLELTCGLTEHVVRVMAYKGARYGLCYVEAPELYELLRHQHDRERVIDEKAYERYHEVTDSTEIKVKKDPRALQKPE